jgi:hypothetical protein
MTASISKQRFLVCYDVLKEILGDEADVLPAPMLGFSIIKCVFQENPEFASKCARQTATVADIELVADDIGKNPFFEKIVQFCHDDPTTYERMLTNLSEMAKALGHGK